MKQPAHQLARRPTLHRGSEMRRPGAGQAELRGTQAIGWRKSAVPPSHGELRDSMLDHISIQVADPAKSAEFYTAALNALGVREAMRHERDGGLVIGLCGPDGFPHFWLGPVGGGECDVHTEREVHIAFTRRPADGERCPPGRR
ncbi:VOC family protein, partial [Streptomyces sp. NPDC002133]|uniref:VOC family protein n=1 Tax=Streptomyces sp. NPDC002133 TaxID=3154409 RepID=UPI003328B3C8